MGGGLAASYFGWALFANARARRFSSEANAALASLGQSRDGRAGARGYATAVRGRAHVSRTAWPEMVVVLAAHRLDT